MMTTKKHPSAKLAAVCMSTLLVALFAPRVTYAYLSPSTISLVLASSGTVFVAAAAVVFAYGIIALSWIKRHRALTTLIIFAPVLGLGGVAFGWYGEFQELRAINSFDASIVKENEQWNEFIEGFAADHAGVNKEAFVQEDKLSVENVKKVVPSTTFEEAEDNGYTLIGPYCEPVTFAGASTSCALGNLVLLDPMNEEEIHETMAELGVEKDDPIVTFCDGGLRSSLTALVLKQYGYNVQGRAALYQYESEAPSQWESPNDTTGSSSRTIFKKLTADIDEPVVMFTAFKDYSILDDRPILDTYIENEAITVLHVDHEFFTEEGKALDPVELPIARFTEGDAEAGVETSYDIRQSISDRVVVCTAPLNCLTARSYLDHIGRPQDTIFCLDCGSGANRI